MTRYKYDGGKNDGQYEAWNAQKFGRPNLLMTMMMMVMVMMNDDGDDESFQPWW